MELLTSEIRTRELAEKYIRIQEDTEYLNHILHYCLPKNRVKFDPKQHNFTLETIFKLSVEVAYLLYTCFVKKINIMINKDLLVVSHRPLAMEYLLEIQFDAMTPHEQDCINDQFYLFDLRKSASSYGDYVCSYLKLFLEMAESKIPSL